MRAKMDHERPSAGLWDLKLALGGLVDIEFAAQALMLQQAHAHPDVIHANTGAAIVSDADASSVGGATSVGGGAV